MSMYSRNGVILVLLFGCFATGYSRTFFSKSKLFELSAADGSSVLCIVERTRGVS